MALRTASGLFGSSIIGMKAMVLISRLAQVYRGMLADTAIREVEIRDQQKIHWVNNIRVEWRS